MSKDSLRELSKLPGTIVAPRTDPIYRCPKCDFEIVYFEQLDERRNPPRDCPNCGTNFARRLWKRSDDVPVRVVVHGADGRQIEQNVSALDWENVEDACCDPRLRDVPSLEIEPHREMYGRSGLAKSGMTETAKFFSARNAIALLELWKQFKKWGIVTYVRS